MVSAPKQYQKSLANLENKIGDKNVLNRKVVQNPKYANVKSTVNTGATAKNATVYSKFAPSMIQLSSPVAMP